MLPTGDHSETPTPRGSRNTSKKTHGRTAARALVASLSTVSLIGMGSAAAPAASAVDLSSLSNAINDLGFPGSPDLGRFLNSGGGDEQGQSPTLTLDKDKDISGGDTLKATGKGYKPGESIYVTQTIEKPASGYPKTYGKAVKVKADEKGNFTTDLTVDTKFRDVDCTTTQCYVASFTAFPKLYDRSQDAWTPISFRKGSPVTVDTEGGHYVDGGNDDDSSGQNEGGNSQPNSGSLGSTSSSGATVSVSKTTDLNPSGDTIRVEGKGFKTDGPGIYVGIAQDDQFSTTNPESFGPDTKWVSKTKGNLNDDGSFSIELPVSATFNNANCKDNHCSIYTLAAHGSSDRSQDTATPVSFKGGIAKKEDGAVTPPASSAGDAVSTGNDDGQATPAANQGGNAQSNNGNSGSVAPQGAASAQQAPAPSGARSSSGAAVTLSKTQNLNPSGDTIRVSGQGFKTSGNGVYVGIAQQDQFSTTNADVFGPGTVWVSNKKGNLNADGSFSIDLPVSATFGSANCLTNACAVYTFAAHGSSDRSQDTATPVSFAGGVAASSAQQAAQSVATGVSRSGGSSGSASSSGGYGLSQASGASGTSGQSRSGARVSVSRTTISPTGKTPVTVTGQGFKTGGNGVYVGVAEKSKFSFTDASVFGATNWVRPQQISSDGSFSTTLNIEPIFDGGNCIKNQCAIFTFAAHGSTDRSQDTVTDITVGGTQQEKESAVKAAEKKAEEKKKAEEARKKAREAKKKNKNKNSKGSKDADGNQAIESENTSSDHGWLYGIIIGILGTLAIVFAALFGIEKRRNSAARQPNSLNDDSSDNE
ncbi:neocarzinostatin apoprotein domain-containing protein [uncultured Corynebacterium sp.]|uniref:neocarzinostatin apoprotein domain-containing protein n=1 Tax=uncultured Corynebacterium sp. TaxID=159447 RepID=UPI0025FDE565|nr:neocarzinostatin apoprotein domain-containing protein [uncultured Corynebacterium sp.]